MNKKVFEGIKVAEFAWVVVGPSTSRYLADHGATVVKIESHKRLDTNRINGPFVGGVPTPDGSMFYGKHNPNKYCISIDLQHPNGRELARKMIAWADIVTESFSPGTMEKWGLGYEDARKIKPDIIYFSSSMQGRGGPHSSYAGYGQNAVNFSGFSEVSGWPDRLPSPPYGAYTDYVSCRFAAFALMAALEYRRRTGKGQYIEQSQFESSLQFFAPPVMDYQINGRIMGRNGNRYPLAAPHGVFQCQGDDRWIAIAIMNEDQWQSFCQVIGKPELANDKDFATFADRKRNEDALEKIISAWTIKHTVEEAEAILQKAGIPSNIVEKPSDLYKDPQLQHRKYFVTMDHPVMGKQKYEHQACFILSKTPRELYMPSPCVGEHNEYVFKELLKMSDEEIAEHLIDGSITSEFTGSMTSSF
ncbi:MAG: CoA transferase [Dehalococcoidales bacterium]|jgi:crotonobetainyl-CoA:carnitine CoA-transferase CaiB-like acyl-CoA transferase|nr:CoA transferase [Dehalococcoidales bacterium]